MEGRVSITIDANDKSEYIIRDSSKITIGRVYIFEVNVENKSCSLKFNFYRNNIELQEEVLRLLINTFFNDMQIKKINIYICEKISTLPFLNIGCTLEGVISNNIYNQGEVYNELIMGINKCDFFQRNSIEFERIKTDNLVLRILTPADSEKMLNYYKKNKKHLEKFEPLRENVFYTEAIQKNILTEDYRQFLNGNMLDFGIFLNEELIGKIKISNIVYGIFKSAIVGYSIDREHEGKGYMNEALNAIIKYSFNELKLHRLEASALIDNEKSKNLLKRCGFNELGVNKDYLYINGKWRDHITFYKVNN